MYKLIKRIFFVFLVFVFTFILIPKYVIPVYAVSMYSVELNSIETKQLNDLVSKKLKISTYNYEIISGMNRVNRYVLVEGENCYLIFDREVLDYLEYSRDSNSIYHNLNKTFKKIYIGPLNYFYETSGQISDLVNNEILSSNEIIQCKLLEDEMTNIYKENKCEEEKAINETTTFVTSLTNESNFIPYSFYYEKLVNNIGTNTVTTFNGSCSYVALEMVLSYYDTVIRDDVIIEARDVTMFRRFSSTERLDASLYPRSPGIDDVFHSNMINLGIDMGFTKQNEFSANSSKLKELLEIYLQGRHLEYTLHSIDLFTSKLNFCKEGINSKNPVVIGIDGIDTSIDSRKLNHAVVAYGYDDSGIFVHFGWKDEDLTKVNINKYNIHSAYYVELNEEHICSDNYVWEKNGCSGTLCPCGSIICNHITRTILKYDYFYHKNQCVGCGCFSLQEHNYYESNEYKICSDCGYKIEKNHSHVYLYKSSRDGRTHNAICRCGYSKTEVCMGYIAIGDVTASCTKCGQSII